MSFIFLSPFLFSIYRLPDSFLFFSTILHSPPLSLLFKLCPALFHCLLAAPTHSSYHATKHFPLSLVILALHRFWQLWTRNSNGHLIMKKTLEPKGKNIIPESKHTISLYIMVNGAIHKSLIFKVTLFFFCRN